MEREVVDALRQLTSALNVLQVTTRDAERSSPIYRGFVVTVTGTTPQTVWDAPTGMRWKLKGYAVTGIVAVTLVSADEVLLYFADSGDSNRCVAPIAALDEDAAAGTHIHAGANFGFTPYAVSLGTGRLASSATANLVITTDIDIGAGEIKLCGTCWGEEVAL